MIQNVYSHRYPDADTYTGHAAHEIDHHEFLKTYSVDSAIGDILSAMEQAAAEEGYVLLTVDINYDDSGLFYHMFDVDYKFTDPTLAVQTTSMQNVAIQQMQIPWVALLPVIATILSYILAYIFANSIVTDLKDTMYSPSSDTGGGLSTSTVIKYGVILIAAAYFLKAVTGTSQELRRY